jgi:hypothetical protein
VVSAPDGEVLDHSRVGDVVAVSVPDVEVHRAILFELRR